MTVLEEFATTDYLPDTAALPGAMLGGREMPTITVVVPTLNEEKNVESVLTRIPYWVDEVIVVDGRSTDDTVATVRRIIPRARILTQKGKGKGDALACGFEAATCDIIVMLDSDGSTDPGEIPRFIAALCTGGDFAKGTRFITGGGSADITTLRRLGNRVLAAIVNRSWGVHYSDLCYGYNAFWRRCLPALSVDSPGFEVETLLNIKAARAGLNVVEVASYESNRLNGLSNLRAVRDGIRVLRTILAERIRPR